MGHIGYTKLLKSYTTLSLAIESTIYKRDTMRIYSDQQIELLEKIVK